MSDKTTIQRGQVDPTNFQLDPGDYTISVATDKDEDTDTIALIHVDATTEHWWVKPSVLSHLDNAIRWARGSRVIVPLEWQSFQLAASVTWAGSCSALSPGSGQKGHMFHDSSSSIFLQLVADGDGIRGVGWWQVGSCKIAPDGVFVKACSMPPPTYNGVTQAILTPLQVTPASYTP
jgi:hypothetical protein